MDTPIGILVYSKSPKGVGRECGLALVAWLGASLSGGIQDQMEGREVLGASQDVEELNSWQGKRVPPSLGTSAGGGRDTGTDIFVFCALPMGRP